MIWALLSLDRRHGCRSSSSPGSTLRQCLPWSSKSRMSEILDLPTCPPVAPTAVEVFTRSPRSTGDVAYAPTHKTTLVKPGRLQCTQNALSFSSTIGSRTCHQSSS